MTELMQFDKTKHVFVSDLLLVHMKDGYSDHTEQ